MSEQRQDWAALRVACDNTLAGRSVDSHIDPRFVLDLLAEVDRLTEALEAAEQEVEQVSAETSAIKGLWAVDVRRFQCAEADLAELRAGVEALIESADCNQRPVTWRLDPDGLRKLLL